MGSCLMVDRCWADAGCRESHHSQSERNTRQSGPEWISRSAANLIYENRIAIRHAPRRGDYPGHHPTQLLEGGEEGAFAGVGHGIC